MAAGRRHCLALKQEAKGFALVHKQTLFTPVQLMYTYEPKRCAPIASTDFGQNQT